MTRRQLGWLVLAVLLGALLAWPLVDTREGEDHGESGGPTNTGPADAGAPALGGTPRPGTPAEATPTPGEVASWAVTGRVLAPDGTPLSGARVRGRIRRGQVREELPSARSGADGAFRLDLAPLASWPRPVLAAAYLSVVAEADGYLASEEEELYEALASPGASTTGVELRLYGGGRVRGRVVDEAGSPLSGAMASLSYRGDRGHAGWFDTVAPDGRFVLSGVFAGPHVAAARWGEREVFSASFDVPGGADIRLPDLIVPLTAKFIEGVVVRPDGTPVSGLPVKRYQENPREHDFGVVGAVSDEAGRFRFAAPSEETWYVGVDTRSEREAILCKAGDPPIRVTVPPCRLVVRVVMEDGTPLPGAGLDLMAWPTEDRAVRAALLQGTLTQREASAHAVVYEESEIPNADGTESSLVDDDTLWLITARVPGGVPTEATLDIASGAAEAEITLTVRERLPEATLALTCVRPDGTTLAAWVAEVRTRAGTFLRDLEPDPSGAPLAVPAGPVVLRAEPVVALTWTDGSLPPDSFLVPWAHGLSLPEGGTQRLRLPMRYGGRIRVSVAPDGETRPRYRPADIRIRPRDASEDAVRMLSEWTSIEGEPEQPGNGWVPGTTAVTTAPLAPGDYVLRVHHFALKPYEATVRIESGKTTPVVLAWDE